MGRRRLRRRLRRRRLARHPRHQLRQERPVPQPRQRPLRERRGAGWASSRPAGTPARPGSTRTGTATSTSTSRSTSTRRSTRCSKAKPTLSWRGLEMVAVGPVRPEGRARPLLPQRRRPLRRRDARGGHGGQGARLRLLGARGRLRRRRRPRRLRRERLRPELPLPQRRQGALHRDRHLDRAARSTRTGRRRPGMGLAVGDVDRRRDRSTSSSTTSPRTSRRSTAACRAGCTRTSRARAASARRPTGRSRGAPRSSDLDNDGDLDIPVMNGHIYPQIDRHPELIGTYAAAQHPPRQPRAARPRQRCRTFVDVTDSAGPGWQKVRAHRGLAVADYDDDGDLDLLITAARRARRRCCATTAGRAVVARGDARGRAGRHRADRRRGARQGRRTHATGATSPSGDSYMCTHDPRPHFGLGTADGRRRARGALARRHEDGPCARTCRSARTCASCNPRGSGRSPPRTRKEAADRKRAAHQYPAGCSLHTNVAHWSVVDGRG